MLPLVFPAAIVKIKNRSGAHELIKALWSESGETVVDSVSAALEMLLRTCFQGDSFSGDFTFERVVTQGGPVTASERRCFRKIRVPPLSSTTPMPKLVTLLTQDARLFWGQPKFLAIGLEYDEDEAPTETNLFITSIMDASSVFPSPHTTPPTANRYVKGTVFVLMAVETDKGEWCWRTRQNGVWERHRYSAEEDEVQVDTEGPTGSLVKTLIYVTMSGAEAAQWRHGSEKTTDVEEQSAFVELEKELAAAEALLAEERTSAPPTASHGARIAQLDEQIKALQATRTEGDEDELRRLHAVLVQACTQHLTRDRCSDDPGKQSMLDKVMLETKVLQGRLKKFAPFAPKTQPTFVDVASLAFRTGEYEGTVNIDGKECKARVLEDQHGNKVSVLSLLKDADDDADVLERIKLDVDWAVMTVVGREKLQGLITQKAGTERSFHLCGMSEAMNENVFDYPDAKQGYTHLMLQANQQGDFVMIKNCKVANIQQFARLLSAADATVLPYISTTKSNPSSLTRKGTAISLSRLLSALDKSGIIKSSDGGEANCETLVGMLGKRQPIFEAESYFTMIDNFGSENHTVQLSIATYWQFDGVSFPCMSASKAHQVRSDAERERGQKSAKSAAAAAAALEHEREGQGQGQGQQRDGEDDGDRDDNDEDEEDAEDARLDDMANALNQDGDAAAENIRRRNGEPSTTGRAGFDPTLEAHHFVRRYDVRCRTKSEYLDFSGPCGQLRGLLAGTGHDGVAARLVARGARAHGAFAYFLDKLTLYFPTVVHGLKSDELWAYFVRHTKIKAELFAAVAGKKSKKRGKNWTYTRNIIPNLNKRIKLMQEMTQDNPEETLFRTRIEACGRLTKKEILSFRNNEAYKLALVQKFLDVIQDASLWKECLGAENDLGLKFAVFSTEDYFAAQGHARVLLDDLLAVTDARLKERRGPEERTVTMYAFGLVFENIARSYIGVGFNEYDWGLGIFDLNPNTPAEEAVEKLEAARNILLEARAERSVLERSEAVCKELVAAKSLKTFPLMGKFRGCRALVDASKPAQLEFVGIEHNNANAKGFVSSFQFCVRAPLRLTKCNGGYKKLKSGLGKSGHAFEPKPTLDQTVRDAAAFLVAQNRLESNWTTQSLLDAVLQFALDHE